jgi:dynein light intermediate chain 1, cytosolic
VAIYEQAIKDPKHDQTDVGAGGRLNGSKIEVGTEDMQPFLGKQSEILEQLKVEDEKDRAARKPSKQLDMSPNLDESRRVNEHIGPVQFNVGGIQVDADDMLRKLRVRGSHISFL